MEEAKFSSLGQGMGRRGDDKRGKGKKREEEERHPHLKGGGGGEGGERARKKEEEVEWKELTVYIQVKPDVK